MPGADAHWQMIGGISLMAIIKHAVIAPEIE